jgi:hypothetical protein
MSNVFPLVWGSWLDSDPLTAAISNREEELDEAIGR